MSPDSTPAEGHSHEGINRVKVEQAQSSVLSDYVELLRPRQWVKNVFVLIPLLFSGRVFLPWAIGRTAIAMACFCLLSSAVYCLNDVVDAGPDSRHPRKCRRPIPSGRVSVRSALVLSAV